MASTFTKPKGKAPSPEGRHPYVCINIIDEGTQPGGEYGPARKRHFVWEGLEGHQDDGTPFLAWATYNNSIHEMSTMGKRLASWRGKPFVDSDYGPGPNAFNLQSMLRQPCMLTIRHKRGDKGGIFPDVIDIEPIDPGYSAQELTPVSPCLYFDLDDEPFDFQTFNKLSEKVRARIIASPEYDAIINGKKPAASPNGSAEPAAQPKPQDAKPTREEPAASQESTGETDFDDQIPF